MYLSIILLSRKIHPLHSVLSILCVSDSSRQVQHETDGERTSDKLDQPRNLLLALVGEVGELAELLYVPLVSSQHVKLLVNFFK